MTMLASAQGAFRCGCPSFAMQKGDSYAVLRKRQCMVTMPWWHLLRSTCCDSPQLACMNQTEHWLWGPNLKMQRRPKQGLLALACNPLHQVMRLLPLQLSFTS